MKINANAKIKHAIANITIFDDAFLFVPILIPIIYINGAKTRSTACAIRLKI